MILDANGFWLSQEEPVDSAPPLDGNRSADVVIIGGGYAGMWTAWLIREAAPEAKVALVERGVCGHGPSGRNGGFCNSMWFSLASMRERFGDTGAVGVARASQAAIDEIGVWCEAEGVDASYLRGGYLQISTARAFDGVWDETVEACGSLGEGDAVEELSAEEIQERCASPVFRGGAFFPGSATVNPAQLALGLRRRLLESGVEIFENSKVLGVRASGANAQVRTEGGTVTAPHVVLTAGGAQEAIGPLRQRLTLTSSHMVITEPVPDLLEEIGWTGGECITDARHMLHYFRTTDDGRIAFGWGGGRVVPGARLGGRAEVDPDMAAQVATHMARFFPQLEGRPVAHAWGGPIDVSPSHTPVVGSLDGQVHYAFGFTGNGVGPSRMVAHALTSLVLDRRDEHSRLSIVEPAPLEVPPEPFRFVGGAIIRAGLLRKERAMEAGAQPDPLSVFLAAIPERMGVQIGR